MRIFDISLPISQSLVVWKDDPPLRLNYASHLDRGDEATVSRVDMGLHTGTHVDAPAHFVPGGAGVDRLDLELLVGPALVVEALDTDVLTAEVLEGLQIPPGSRRVLFHTRNSDLWAQGRTDFATDFVAFDASGAQWLIDHGVGLVGIDYLSVAAFHDLIVPHQRLLGAGVIPLEGLNLTDIEPGLYQLICLPLKFAGRDGAPARAILMR